MSEKKEIAIVMGAHDLPGLAAIIAAGKHNIELIDDRVKPPELVTVDQAIDITRHKRKGQYLPFVKSKASTGRNQPCPCGSGKKYKKCCL